MDTIWSFLHRYFEKLYIPNTRSRLQRYGFVFLLIFTFFLIKTVLITTLGKDVPFLFSLFIVTISAWFGGFGPGILATILTGIITLFFYLEPKYTLFGGQNIANAIILFFFFLEGFFISMLSESRRRSDIQKAQFIGVISHELKNPLTTIKGYAEMIQHMAGKQGEQKIEAFAQRMGLQIKQVIGMINDLLDITKIETGRLTYHDESFNICDLLREIVHDQQITSQTHKISVSTKRKIIFTGDRYRIGQVLTNLISNAIKYSPKAKKIYIKTINNKENIDISIQDFGPGISPEDQRNLFRPYFRAKRTHSVKGTGIGLYISSQIAERHNGRLWVESTIGKGSVFHMNLPVRRS